jgi:integrase/recombinase XerD
VRAPTPAVALDRVDLEQRLQLVKLWLNGRSRHTQRSYTRKIELFFAFVNKPLRAVTLFDLQAFAEHLQTLPSLAESSRAQALYVVKSFFAFGKRVGYLSFDVAEPLIIPECKDTLSERILEEEGVQRLIGGATSPRNRLILQLLYHAGVRVSELVELTWRDMQARRNGGQITVFGKGRKTRVVRIEPQIWTALQAMRGAAPAEAPVFVSRRRGGHLDPGQVRRIIKVAAARAGVTLDVSPHWLRHCHASHSLDRGAPLSLVQATLGHSNVATTSKYLHARPSESSSRFLPPI